MANSRFEYVKSFEKESYLLPNAWIVVRVDGRGFHRLSSHYDFAKPNDSRALRLMNSAASHVMTQLPDVVMAYGDSDEYSFLVDRRCNLFERREAKLVSTFGSTFTAFYIQLWNDFFPDRPLELAQLPTFDSRAVIYPSEQNVRDYFAWRQADCHINNLYNTSFWALVLRGGQTRQQAEQTLCGTLAKDKHELLFSRFGINYNNEPEMYKKGTVLVRAAPAVPVPPVDESRLTPRQLDRRRKKKAKADIDVLHVDIIGPQFWADRPHVLS